MELRKIALAGVLVVLGTVLAPAGAQQPTRIPRIGYLGHSVTQPAVRAFRQGLADLGYVRGRNIIIESRFFGDRFDRLPEFAGELVGLHLDVIVVVGAVETRAVEKATTTIPVVFAIVPDPVAARVVASAARPGGNVTGFTSFDPQQPKAQLELLKEAIPKLRRVAILGDEAVPPALFTANELQALALGLQPQLIKLRGPVPDLEGAFAAARGGHADALLVLEHPTNDTFRKQIADRAITDRLPTLFPTDFADAGWTGLMAYGTSLTLAAQQIPVYVDKILKGAKPGDLPVQAITRRQFIINLKTAQRIGVTIPSDVLKQADRVIR